MNTKKVKDIKLSLLSIDGDIDPSTGKAEYIKLCTANFVNKDYSEEQIYEILNAMYIDLLNQKIENVDSIGIWINYEDLIYENAISLMTLNDIKEYSKQEVNPIVEFFKMTIPQ
jgi:hypothetical protein